MPAEVYDAQGRRVALGARLGRGGEGEVFEVVGSPTSCAKILHPAGRTRAKLDKVQAMLDRPPAGATDPIDGLPVLTWPRALLHSRPAGQGPGTFMGFAMTRVAPRDFVPFYQLTSASRRKALGGAAVTWDRLVLLGLRLCHVVRTLHRFGYAVGDLNDRNVLVSRRLTPLLMDTDSFQVPKPGWGHFPSVVGDAQYWAPELLDVDLAKHTASRMEGDRYALGVLLFQLFLGGVRPYQSRGSAVDGLETLAEKTKAGHYPWDSPKPGVLEPPASAPSMKSLPPAIQAAFRRCFVDGHRRPGKRPSADDWYQTLSKVYAAGFETCKADARHTFVAGLRACPWCADANDPFDPDPARHTPKAAKRAKPATPVRPSSKTKRTAGPPQAPLPKMALATAKAPAPKPVAARPGSKRTAPIPAAAKRAAATPTRRSRPSSTGAGNAWPSRTLWVGALVLAFASPTALLQLLPLGFPKEATMSVMTALCLAAAGSWATLRWVHGRGAKVATVWLWLIAATAATLAVAAAGRWEWLVWTTGAASLALGLAVVARLERGRPDAFRPRGAGLWHGVAGLPVAYLPVLVAWLAASA